MDNHPIRNKSKDNPYTLKFDKNKNIYTVEFKDSSMKTHNVEISEEVYNAFNKFELEDVSQIHYYQRHIEHSEIYDETLEHRMMNKPVSFDKIVETKILLEDIKKNIKLLPDIQRRRLIKYYFENKTLEEIASEENCSKVAVKYSIDIAIEKISQNFKN